MLRTCYTEHIIDTGPSLDGIATAAQEVGATKDVAWELLIAKVKLPNCGSTSISIGFDCGAYTPFTHTYAIRTSVN